MTVLGENTADSNRRLKGNQQSELGNDCKAVEQEKKYSPEQA